MRIPLMVLALLAAAPAIAQVTPGDRIPAPRIENGRVGGAYAPLLSQLRSGGLVLLIRHERTDLDSRWDTADHRPQGECARERNLSSVGREGSWTMGEAIRMLKIPIGVVVASPFCRAVDTARLAFRRVDQVTPRLVGSDGGGRTYDMVRRDLIAIMDEHAGPGANLVLVGHGGTILAFTDTLLEEGEALILRPRSGRQPEIVGRMPASRWDELVRDNQRVAAGI